MAGYIVVIGDPEKGTSHQFEVEDVDWSGRTLGETVDGTEIGLPGYELELTGGSDAAGRPMRADVEGRQPTEVLSSGGTGFHPSRKGERKRITVRGNEIGGDTVQLNMKITTRGDQSIEELLE